MTVIQFAPFSSLVEPGFWHALTNLKIDVLKLSDHSLPIAASYTSGRSVVDRETGNEIALGCNITVGGDAFTEKPQYVELLLSGDEWSILTLMLVYPHTLYWPPVCSRTTTRLKNSRRQTRLLCSISYPTRCCLALSTDHPYTSQHAYMILYESDMGEHCQRIH